MWNVDFRCFPHLHITFVLFKVRALAIYLPIIDACVTSQLLIFHSILASVLKVFCWKVIVAKTAFFKLVKKFIRNMIYKGPFKRFFIRDSN